MSKSANGGGYQTFFPLSHRKHKFSEIIKIEPASPSGTSFSTDSARKFKAAIKIKQNLYQSTQESIQKLFCNDYKISKLVCDSFEITERELFISWVAKIEDGKLEHLPPSLKPLFQVPLRAATNLHFDNWFCLKSPKAREPIIQQMREESFNQLVKKARDTFISPQYEVSCFVDQLSALQLYEIVYTEYTAYAISQLSQSLRRRDRY